jgi:hypothetical protein
MAGLMLFMSESDMANAERFFFFFFETMQTDCVPTGAV